MVKDRRNLLHDYFVSVLLGIVEGLTEFLPVSSTAHLRLSQSLLGIDLANGYWKMYAIVIQLGAILCLPIYFRSRIANFLSTFPKGERGNRTVLDHPITLVLIAFVFTGGPAFLLTKVIGKHLESFYIMGSSLLIGGVIMWLVDAFYGRIPPSGRYKTEHVEEMSVLQAIWIGVCQITSAVFPGTSRSMSTIAAGQISGMSRAAALEFSFFVSIPTMIFATAYDMWRTFHPKNPALESTLGRMPANPHEWIVLIIGFVVSFFVALGVVAWFMNWVRSRGFVPFAIYRIIIGIAVLAWAMSGHVF